jgi:5'-nucleotidase
MAGATLVPMSGHEGAYSVQMNWGEALELPLDTDGGAVEAGYVAVSCLTRIQHEDRDDLGAAWDALDGMIGVRR